MDQSDELVLNTCYSSRLFSIFLGYFHVVYVLTYPPVSFLNVFFIFSLTDAADVWSTEYTEDALDQFVSVTHSFPCFPSCAGQGAVCNL